MTQPLFLVRAKAWSCEPSLILKIFSRDSGFSGGAGESVFSKSMACSSPFSALIKYLEGVSLALQPFYGAREGVEDFVVTLDGVVEGDDAAWAG